MARFQKFSPWHGENVLIFEQWLLTRRKIDTYISANMNSNICKQNSIDQRRHSRRWRKVNYSQLLIPTDVVVGYSLTVGSCRCCWCLLTVSSNRFFLCRYSQTVGSNRFSLSRYSQTVGSNRFPLCRYSQTVGSNRFPLNRYSQTVGSNRFSLCGYSLLDPTRLSDLYSLNTDTDPAKTL